MRSTASYSLIDLLSTDNKFVSADMGKISKKQLDSESRLGSIDECFVSARVLANTPKLRKCYKFDGFRWIRRRRVQRNQCHRKIPMQQRRKLESKIESTRIPADTEWRITRSKICLMQCDQRDVLASATGYSMQPSITVLLGRSTTKNATRIGLKPFFQVNLIRK